MFKSKTSFILGAGASIPYGFPSGYQLVTDIINNLNDAHQRTLLYEVNKGIVGSLFQFNTDDINKFRASLSKTPVESIDDFLEARPEYLNIGKAAIAQALIPYEKEERLFERNQKTNWYAMIFEVLRKDLDALIDSQISFITFNYDRSLEHYLYTQFREYLNLSCEECKRVINKIPIIHVYGHIGYLNWQNNEYYRNYSNEIDASIVSRGMVNLSVIHESTVVNDNFIKAKRLIQWSDKIRFLGFGFHNTNTERLQLAKCAEGKDVRATSYGLTTLQRRSIARISGIPIRLDRETNRDIVRYFTEEVPLD